MKRHVVPIASSTELKTDFGPMPFPCSSDCQAKAYSARTFRPTANHKTS